MTKGTILYIDDDVNLRTVVSEYLADEGYEVLCAGSRQQAIALLDQYAPDVVLLDLTLPDADGLEILTLIRSRSAVPVIITSGKSETTERIIGIEMGADDYLTKPFDMREMVARIKAQLRRRPQEAVAPAAVHVPAMPAAAAPVPEAAPGNVVDMQAERELRFADMRLDRDTFQVYGPDGQSLHFTSGEFRLLEGLLLARNRVLTREQLFNLTREGEFLPFDRAIDIQISRIRKKINDDDREHKLIQTIRGVGYMFSERQNSKAS